MYNAGKKRKLWHLKQIPVDYDTCFEVIRSMQYLKSAGISVGGGGPKLNIGELGNRILHVELSSNTLRTYLYDYNNGVGVAEHAIDSLRNRYSVISCKARYKAI